MTLGYIKNNENKVTIQFYFITYLASKVVSLGQKNDLDFSRLTNFVTKFPTQK